MNRYYEKEQLFYSNNRIFEDCFSEAAKEDVPVKRALRAALKAIKKAVCSVRVQRIAKAVAFTGCLLGMLGLIGAMEAGSLSIGTGLLLSVALLGLEYLCLRNH